MEKTVDPQSTSAVANPSFEFQQRRVCLAPALGVSQQHESGRPRTHLDHGDPYGIHLPSQTNTNCLLSIRALVVILSAQAPRIRPSVDYKKQSCWSLATMQTIVDRWRPRHS